jgi:oxygen-independent coproporphyrinogen-3 oxidase
VRWWNVKHPAAYAGRLASGRSPAAAREVLGEEQRCTERVLLCVRLREGLPVAEVPEPGEAAALAGEGLLDGLALEEGRVRLTRNGRLLADLVVRRLLG